jgi:hypothetical protein
MRRRGLTVILIFLLLSTGLAFAGGKGSGRHSSGYSGGDSSGTVHVDGYTRSDGTYVHGYDRAAPGQGGASTSTYQGQGKSSDHQPANKYQDISAAVPRNAKAITIHPGETISFRNGIALKRDANGHIVRSEEARAHFMKLCACPSTGKTSGPCPGYVVDHIVALKHGGADEPWNMQWQTIEAAKAKDKWE